MSWDDEAAGWDDDPAVRAYSRAAFRSLRAACDARAVSLRNTRVLDFGCGTGALAEAMSAVAREVVALDASPAMLAVLRTKIVQRPLPNVHAVLGGLPASLDEPALQEPFDLITCASVCAFLDDYPTTASLLASRLAPGGLFVQWDWALDPSAEAPFGLTPDAICAALSGAGLRDVVVDVGFREAVGEAVMAPLRGIGRRP